MIVGNPGAFLIGAAFPITPQKSCCCSSVSQLLQSFAVSAQVIKHTFLSEMQFFLCTICMYLFPTLTLTVCNWGGRIWQILQWSYDGGWTMGGVTTVPMLQPYLVSLIHFFYWYLTNIWYQYQIKTPLPATLWPSTLWLRGCDLWPCGLWPCDSPVTHNPMTYDPGNPVTYDPVIYDSYLRLC